MNLKLNLKRKKLDRACDFPPPEDQTPSREAQSAFISTFNYRVLLLNSMCFAHGKLALGVTNAFPPTQPINTSLPHHLKPKNVSNTEYEQCVCVWACTCVYVHMHMCLCMCLYVCIHVCCWICMCVCWCVRQVTSAPKGSTDIVVGTNFRLWG